MATFALDILQQQLHWTYFQLCIPNVHREMKSTMATLDPLSRSTYKLERHFFRHGCRTALKFGTHVRIDTLTLNKKIDPPHPMGV